VNQLKGVGDAITYFVNAAAGQLRVAFVRRMKLQSIQVERIPREPPRQGSPAGSSERAGQAEKHGRKALSREYSSNDDLDRKNW
jgi:hypothetical protein